MEIELTQGKVALVDDADFEALSKHRWYYNVSAGGYAARNVVLPSGERGIELMHRAINETPAGFDTDHINHDRLDNRRANLRTATRQLNQQNRSAMRANSSGVRGVSFDRHRGKWAAYIKVDYRKISLGRWDSLDDAAEARRKAEAIYFV